MQGLKKASMRYRQPTNRLAPKVIKFLKAFLWFQSSKRRPTIDKNFFSSDIKSSFLWSNFWSPFLLFYSISSSSFLPEPQFWNMRPNFCRTGSLRWPRMASKEGWKVLQSLKLDLDRARNFRVQSGEQFWRGLIFLVCPGRRANLGSFWWFIYFL